MKPKLTITPKKHPNGWTSVCVCGKIEKRASGNENLLTIWEVSLTFFSPTNALEINSQAKFAISLFGWFSHKFHYSLLTFPSEKRWTLGIKQVGFSCCNFIFLLNKNSNVRRVQWTLSPLKMLFDRILFSLWQEIKATNKNAQFFVEINLLLFFWETIAGIFSRTFVKTNKRKFQYGWKYSDFSIICVFTSITMVLKTVWFSRRRSSTTANSTSGYVMRLGVEEVLLFGSFDVWFRLSLYMYVEELINSGTEGWIGCTLTQWQPSV